MGINVTIGTHISFNCCINNIEQVITLPKANIKLICEVPPHNKFFVKDTVDNELYRVDKENYDKLKSYFANH